MKTTYPYRWKANRKDTNVLMEGQTLTTCGDGRYAISPRSYVQVALAPHDYRYNEDRLVGIEIDTTTLYWQCYKCREWNHRKEIACKCGAILDKFKEDIIDG